MSTRTSGTCAGISPERGHSAAVIFVRFAEGNYGEAAQESGTAAGRLEDTGTNSCLTRAFKIVREHAALLDTSSPRPQTFLTFSPEDADLLAKPAPILRRRTRNFIRPLTMPCSCSSVLHGIRVRTGPHSSACMRAICQKLLKD